jgi:hypothetical protein
MIFHTMGVTAYKMGLVARIQRLLVDGLVLVFLVMNVNVTPRWKLSTTEEKWVKYQKLP